MSRSERQLLVPKMPNEGNENRDQQAVEKGKARFLLGITYLIGVVLLWSVSNFITAALETGDQSWNKPFLITYLNTASFIVYLIPSYYKYRKTTKTYEPLPTTERSVPLSPRAHRGSTIRSSSVTPSLNRVSLDNANRAIVADLPPLTVLETAKVAAWWSAVWFLGNWSVNAALAWTSVASATILTSTSGFFTLALGRVFHVETFTQIKVFAAAASFIGVVLVTRSDNSLQTTTEPAYPNLPSHPILGDIACLISATCYAIYVVLLKVQLGDEDRADPMLLLGFAGLYNVIFLIPVFPLLHWSGIETFELPPNGSAWVICGINMLITLSSDYLYILAVLKTSPMLVTVGLSLTIPCALVGTLFVPSATVNAITLTSLIGAVLVCAGFALLSADGWTKSQEGPEDRAVFTREEDSERLEG